MGPKTPREKKHFKRLRRTLTKIVGLFGRKSSNVPAPTLPTASGESRLHSRPNAEIILPAANSSPGGIPETPVAIARVPADPTTLHPSEEHEIPSAKTSQEQRDADADAFECSDDAPCFNEAVARFKSDNGDRYKAIFEGGNSGLGMVNAGSESNAMSHEGSQRPLDRFESSTQGFKLYLPSLGSVQSLAMALSKLDPHGIAPIVLSGVFFVITLTLNSLDPTLREKVSTLLSKTNTVMKKWMLYEIAQAKRIPTHKSEGTEKLTEWLPALYVKAFETISLIQEFFKPKVLSALQRSISDIENRVSHLERHDRECAIQKDKVDEELKSLEKIANILKWIRGEKNPEPSHASVVCQTGLDKRDTEAALWLLSTPQFKSWVAQLALDKAERVFWLEGIMGSGKTTLICRLISHFKQNPIKETQIAYYYCYGSTTEDQRRGPDYEQILRGLCHRLARNEDGAIAKCAVTLYEECHDPYNWTTHPNMWENLLRDLIVHSKRRTLFIIDALDESSTMADRQKLFRFMYDMQQHGLYMILSSRPDTGIREVFKKSITPFPVVTTEAKKDMETFVDKEIAIIQKDPCHSASRFLDEENLKRLRDALINQANGMFRWVQLWLGVFFNPNRKSTVLRKPAKEMLEMLESQEALPSSSQGNDIAEVYKKLWDINGDGDEIRKRHQTRIFRFVLAVEGPLFIDMLLDAIRFDPKPSEGYTTEIDLAYLETLYHNFLRNRRGFLEFEHVSAKTFILKMQDSNKKQSLFADELQNHRTIAETSLMLLRDPAHKLWEETDPKEYGHSRHHRHPRFDRHDPWTHHRWRETVPHNRLTFYVLFHWPVHCRKIQDTGTDTELRCLLLRTLSEMPIFLRCQAMEDMWGQCSCLTRSIDASQVACPLLFALTCGISPFRSSNGVVEIYPNLGDIMTRNLNQETPLHVAVQQNDHHSLKCLLDIHSRADSNVPLLYSLDSKGRSLLHLAKNFEMVKILLEFEAEWTNTDHSSPNELHHSTLLQEIDKKGTTSINKILEWCDEDSAAWIIEKFQFTYRELTEALHYPIWHVAVRRGFRRVIHLLLERGAFIDGIDCPDGTALGVAAAMGDEDMALFLLERGADVNAVWGQYGTPLGAAVHHRKENMFHFFLRHDVDLDRAIRFSPDSDNEQWDSVGDKSREATKILQYYGRRHAISGADESAGDLKK